MSDVQNWYWKEGPGSRPDTDMSPGCVATRTRNRREVATAEQNRLAMIESLAVQTSANRILKWAAEVERVVETTTIVDIDDFLDAAKDPMVKKINEDARAYADSLVARGHCRCHLVVNCPDA